MTDKQRRLIFFAIVCLLVSLALVQHLGRMKSIGFTTHDDMAIDLMAQEVNQGGFPAYLARAKSMAVDQGRVTYYVSLVFFLAPYFVDSDVFRAVISTGIQLLSVAALAAFMALYVEPVAAAFFLLIFYILLPHQWSHFPLASYPVFYHVPTAFFFIALTIYVARFRGVWILRASPVTRPLCYFLMGWSLILYEPLSLIFTAALIGVVLFEGRDKTSTGLAAMVKGGVRRHRGIVLLFAAVSAAYLIYRAGHSPTYVGTALSAASVTNLAGMFEVIWYFSAFGFPAASFFSQPEFISRFSIGSIAQDGWLRFVLNNLTGTNWFFAALFGAGVVFLLWNIRAILAGSRKNSDCEDNGQFARTRFLAPLAIAGVLGFLAALVVEIPVSLSPKYQADPRGWAPYITGYFSYIGFTAGFAPLLLFAVWRAAQKSVMAHRLAVIGIGGVCFGMALLNGVASDAMVRSQADHYAKWRLLRLAEKSGEFRALQNGSVIVAPSLWDGISPAWQDAATYWPSYFEKHFGKQVRVVPDWPALGSEQVGVYYGSVIPGTDAGDFVLLFAKVDWCEGGACGSRLSNRVSVFSLGDLKSKDLSVVLPEAGACRQLFISETGRSKGIQQAIPLREIKPVAGGYRAVVETGGAMLENAAVIADTDQRQPTPTVEVAFEKGFYGLEKSGSSYWRWSEGPSGTGILGLVNHAQVPVQVTFSARIATDRSGKIPCEVNAGGSTDKLLTAHLDQFSRTLSLLPGRNEISVHCSAERLNSPNDPRYIVFGLQNWSVVDAGTFAHLRGTSKDGIENTLDVKFVEGFSGLEQSGNSYWRWSDGAEGKGAIEFNNRTGKLLKVLFTAESATGHPETSRLEIDHGSKTGKFEITDQRQRISMELSLPAGLSRMLLKSDARRVAAPSDPRFLIFAIYNWRVFSMEASMPDLSCLR
jgi:hypothetical protein